MRRAAPLLLLLAVGCGTDVSGPARSLLSCLLNDPVALQPGQVLQLSGAQHQAVCLEDPTGGEYLYIPFHAREAPDDEPRHLALALTGHGLAGGTPTAAERSGGTLTLSLGRRSEAGAVRRDDSFHDRLRARERAELEPRIRTSTRPPHGSAAANDRLPPTTAAAPEVGSRVDYNVAISCSEADVRTGRVEYVSQTAVVVADVENPPFMFPLDYRHFGETFDTLVGPVGVEHFGAPGDIDGNGRVVIFFTRAVNELTEPGSDTYTGGFFWSGDLFPQTATGRLEACPAANQAEMFYMLVADPAGEAGPPFTLEFIRNVTVPTLAHEYQHLINASRRLYVNEARVFERVWLNEGLSHVAEELLFYSAAGLGPGMNLTVEDLEAVPEAVASFNRFMAGGNMTNLLRYLQEPDTTSLMGVAGLPTRGASWAFLRYAADRSARDDEAFFFDLVNSREAGIDNLDGVLGESAVEWMQDWTVAVYADDAVDVVAARFTQPSWNYRDIYRRLVGWYPLQVEALDPDEPRRLELGPGGAAFPWFDIGPGGRAVIHVETGGDAPPAALRGSFLRIR